MLRTSVLPFALAWLTLAAAASPPEEPPAASPPAVCWMATVEERTTAGDVVPVTSPKVAGIRKAAQAAEAVLRASPHLRALPEARLRASLSIGDGSPRPAFVQAQAFLPACWQGECGLHPKADALGCSAALSIGFNTTDPLLDWPLRDERLRASLEPERAGELHGYPVFRKGPMTVVLLAAGGKLPWAPLAVAEYLDFQERELARRAAALEGEKAEASAAAAEVDEGEIREAYEQMLEIDPEGAELFRRRMARLMEQIPKEIAGRFAEQDAELARELAELRAVRAALTPEQAAAQARAGTGRFGLPAPGQDPGKLAGWVKDDPAFGWDAQDANRVQLVLVARGQAFPQWNAGFEAAFENLDYAALAALLR